MKLNYNKKLQSTKQCEISRLEFQADLVIKNEQSVKKKRS